MKNNFRVIGLMSGSSMDGVDLACCEFYRENANWNYKIICGQTFPYSEMWRVRLSQLYKQNIETFPKTNAFYGRYLGQLVNQFIKENSLIVDFVASHGHTIFHQPGSGFTAQIGDGAAISAICGLPVVCDFRSMDIALGGQGAPLVPIGDKLLFAGYDACLNLGGISNISFSKQDKIIAFDISPCNIVLNRLARSLGQPYDDKGRMAESGVVNNDLLEELNSISYYQQNGAKSLGREWINSHFWPVVKEFHDISEIDKIATLTTHIAFQIVNVINSENLNKILVSGGGAFNDFLIRILKSKVDAEIVIPEKELIEYKEALIFALLGVLRITNENNVLATATGSAKDHVGGALYGNFKSLY